MFTVFSSLSVENYKKIKWNLWLKNVGIYKNDIIILLVPCMMKYDWLEFTKFSFFLGWNWKMCLIFGWCIVSFVWYRENPHRNIFYLLQIDRDLWTLACSVWQKQNRIDMISLLKGNLNTFMSEEIFMYETEQNVMVILVWKFNLIFMSHILEVLDLGLCESCLLNKIICSFIT